MSLLYQQYLNRFVIINFVKLYLVRHGESKHNVLNLHQDEENSLSQDGVKQAKILANRFRDIPIEVVISSNATRAQQTAEEVNKVIHKKIFYTDTLREIRKPSAIIGKKKDDPQIKEVMELLDKNAKLIEWHFSDEENYYDFRNRVRGFFDYLTIFQEKEILVITHSICLQMLVSLMCFGNEVEYDSFLKIHNFMKTKNTGITVCEKREDKWRLITWNDHAHLG